MKLINDIEYSIKYLKKIYNYYRNMYIHLKYTSIKTKDIWSFVAFHSWCFKRVRRWWSIRYIDQSSIKLQFRNILEHAITRIYASSGSRVQKKTTVETIKPTINFRGFQHPGSLPVSSEFRGLLSGKLVLPLENR